MGILAVEDALIARIRAVLGNRVRVVDSLPGDWDDDMLRRFAAQLPAVFIAFAGGGSRAPGATTFDIDGQWIVYVATGHASGQAARRRGDALQIGAYELVELLVPQLHLFKVPDTGTLMAVRVENLYTGSIDRQGLAVYALTFQLPMSMPLQLDPAVLDDFETFTAQYDVPPHTPAEHPKWLAGDFSTSNPDATETVTLPTA